jgi:hypothetical protein
MDVLSTATGKANELIGKGFVDALSRASGGTEASDATIFLETLAGGFNKVTLAAGTAIGAIPSLIKNVKDLGKSIFFGFAGKQIGVTLSTPSKKPIQSGSNLNKSTATTENKIAKENLKINTAQLKLAKAKSIFDIQKIQIEAALKGKISEEDRIRLKLMQAIEDENISQIDKYTKMLDEAQKNTEKLVTTLASIKPLDDIFKNWNFMSVKAQLDTLEGYFKSFAGSAASAFNTLGSAQKAALGGFVPFVGATNKSLGITSNGGTTTSMPSTVGLGTSGTGNQLPAGVTINTNVNTGIGDPETIARAVEDVIRQAVQRGTSSLLLPV